MQRSRAGLLRLEAAAGCNWHSLAEGRGAVQQLAQAMQRASRPAVDLFPGLQGLGGQAKGVAIGQNALGCQTQMADDKGSQIGAGSGNGPIDEVAVFLGGTDLNAPSPGPGDRAVQWLGGWLYGHCTANGPGLVPFRGAIA